MRGGAGGDEPEEEEADQPSEGNRGRQQDELRMVKEEGGQDLSAAGKDAVDGRHREDVEMH